MLTLFIPGLEELADAAAPRLPSLELLLARGRTRPAAETSCWAALARAGGGDLERWPVGPVSALAELGAAEGCWLRLEPLGMDAEQRGAFRLRASALEIEADEATALAAAFNATFAADGIRLAVPSCRRWYLHRQDVDGEPWRGFPGPALAPEIGDRPAPPEAALRRLMSEVEMLFFAHPVNEARRERGRPLIAGLHPWGGGWLDGAIAKSAPAAEEEPYLTGLRRLGVLPPAAPDSVFGDGLCWPVAPEALSPAVLEALEENLLGPLVSALRRGAVRRLRLLTDRREHRLATTDVFRFWRTPRHWASAC
jgi:hypothetical protein